MGVIYLECSAHSFFLLPGLSLLSSVGKFKEPPLSLPLCLPVSTKKAVESRSLPEHSLHSVRVPLGGDSSRICLTNLKKIYKSKREKILKKKKNDRQVENNFHRIIDLIWDIGAHSPKRRVIDKLNYLFINFIPWIPLESGFFIMLPLFNHSSNYIFLIGRLTPRIWFTRESNLGNFCQILSILQLYIFECGSRDPRLDC